MRTLELRLEDLRYGLVGTQEDNARAIAALEFFDRAYLQALGGVACRSDKDFRIGETLTVGRESVAFALARNATLLRFGVRIVGLLPIASQSGAEWPKTLAWEEESTVLVAEPAVAREVDRRWVLEPKLRELLREVFAQRGATAELSDRIRKVLGGKP